MSQQQLQSLIRFFRSQPANPNETVDEARRGFERMATLPMPAEITSEPINAGGADAEWISAPGADAGRVILYLHGGFYVIGSIATHRGLAGRIARAARARVLLLGYRLAPEHPFPAALEDSLAAYRWLLANGATPARIVIAGDSAGGGLAMATLIAIRDAGLPMPAAGVCLSPWVDLACTGESMTANAAADPLIQRDESLRMAKHYLAGKDPRTPFASPLYADLAGLPPLMIQVGTTETLFDDARRLAERARRAGLEIAFEPWENMIHVFQAFAAMLDEGQQAIDRIGAFIISTAP